MFGVRVRRACDVRAWLLVEIQVVYRPGGAFCDGWILVRSLAQRAAVTIAVRS